MTDDKLLKEEFKESRVKEPARDRCEAPLHTNKTLIIVVALITLTVALVSGQMSEAVYSGLMGSFLAFTFGRIFSEQTGYRKNN